MALSHSSLSRGGGSDAINRGRALSVAKSKPATVTRALSERYQNEAEAQGELCLVTLQVRAQTLRYDLDAVPGCRVRFRPVPAPSGLLSFSYSASRYSTRSNSDVNAARR